MSTIEKLSIQGIRSFGIKQEDKQNIKFQSPITFILGANGCGKTTIIECLKYVLTGEVPPGSGRGQSFVHDPKIFDFPESLGQSKLVVKNPRGEYLTITRSMKIGMKRGKQCFENLDSTLCYGKDGSTEMHSRRIVDIDAEVVQFMGVSKAIINNVLFCHQDDSTWPLDESKKVKEKFDEIFGTTEYNKAIDKLIKMRIKQRDLKKDKDADLIVAKHLKTDAENKKLDLINAQKKLENIQLKHSQLDDSLKPLDVKFNKILDIEKKIGKIQADKIEIETKLENCRDQIKRLATKIKKIHDGDIDDIEAEIRNFQLNKNEKCIKRDQLEEQLEIIKNEENHLQKQLTDLEKKYEYCLNQRQHEQSLNEERAEKITQLCCKLQISINSDVKNLSNYEIENIFDKIEKSFESEDQKISKISSEHDKIESSKQLEIDNYRENKTKIESDIASKKSQEYQQSNDCHELERKINEYEANANNLTLITKKIEIIDKEYKEKCQNINLNEKKKNIDSKNITVKELQDRFYNIDEKLTFLNEISTKLTEINLVEKDLEKRRYEVQRIKSKHSDNINRTFPNQKIDNNYKRHFQSANDNQKRIIEDLNAEQNSLNLKHNELKILRKNQNVELMKYEKELQDNKETIFDKCQSTPYDELLIKVNENIQKLQLDYGAIKSSESMYKKYIKKIRENPCCPLCHKGLNDTDIADLTTEMSDEIHHLPDNMNRTRAQLKKEEQNKEELLHLRPLIDRVEFLEVEIPKIKENLSKNLVKLSETYEKMKSSQCLLAEQKSKFELINNMLTDMSLLDDAIRSVNGLQEKLQKLKSELPDGSMNDTKENVQIEKATLAAELKHERSELEKVQSEYEIEKAFMDKLRDKRNSLKDQQIKLQEGLQSLPQLKIQFAEIKVKIEILLKDIETLEKQLTPIGNALNAAIKDKEIIKLKNRDELTEMKDTLNSIKTINGDIQRLSKELKSFSSKNLMQEIEKLKRKIHLCKTEQTKKAQENKIISEKFENMKMDICNEELVERDLRDNRELKEWQNEEEILNVKNNELSKNYGDLDIKKVAQEREKIQAERGDITNKKSELIGKIGEIIHQIQNIENELEIPKFKDSVMNYRLLKYEVNILEKFIDDLGQYRIALEWSLMQFHKEKMEKINQIIREYWTQIYRGNDIDYIEIQTTDDSKSYGVGTTTASADKKRSYSYRVVQSKNGKKIDMRGRCSAGQRVLASLIIRMALAETFSSNCGVLALDEPTTNLDKVNIESLCTELNRIVEDREGQQNFMLIIITHDRFFLSHMRKLPFYHTVSRNKDGKSYISKCRLE